MPKICKTAKANFSLPNAFENARFELFGILKCQLATLLLLVIQLLVVDDIPETVIKTAD